MIQWLKSLFSKAVGSTAAKGSAFVKIAERETALLEAKGKVIALKAAHSAEKAAISVLQKDAEAIHEESGVIADKLAAVHSLL